VLAKCFQGEFKILETGKQFFPVTSQDTVSHMAGGRHQVTLPGQVFPPVVVVKVATPAAVGKKNEWEGAGNRGLVAGYMKLVKAKDKVLFRAGRRVPD
jgi:hypothetical protein